MGWTVAIAPTAYTPQIATDPTQRTVTTTAFNQLSGNFSIPANDAEVGSVYKLVCWGTFNPGATVTTLTIQPVIFGVSLTALALTALSSNVVTGFTVETWVIVDTAGVTGSLSAKTQWLAGGTQDQTALQNITASGVNTVAAATFDFQAKWSVITGNPTITGFASVYERDGPGAVAQ